MVRRVVGRFSYSPRAGHLSSSVDTSGEILLLAPGWTSLVIVRRVAGRFSYSPLAGHLWSSFGAWWGDSLTRPRLDISRHWSAGRGEILLLAPSWALWTLSCARWGDSLTHPRLDISHRRSARGGEILLLAPGWTSLVIRRHVMGRFSYSPQAGHLSLSFGEGWGDSITRPKLDISGRRSARDGEILLLAPGWTSLVIRRHVMGRFSYSPQAGYL